MIRGIHHVSIHTANFDKMRKFYQDAFGFEPVGPEIAWENDPNTDKVIGVPGSAARLQMFRAGTCHVEMFEYFAPKARADEAPLRPHDHGYTHFCVDCTDIYNEFKRLQELGMTFVNPEPIRTGDYISVYGKDPDGNLIEIHEVVPSNILSLESLKAVSPMYRTA